MADEAQQRLAEATAAYGAGQWQEAADAFAGLILDPSLPAEHVREMHWNIAICYHHLDQNQLAIEHMEAGGFTEDQYAHALGLQPGHGHAQDPNHTAHEAQQRFHAALQLYEGQHWQEAADAFAELLVDPGFPASDVHQIHWNLAMCYGHLGYHGEDGDWHLAVEHAQAAGYSEHDLTGAMGHVQTREAARALQHATQLYEHEQWQQAADAFGQLLLTGPSTDDQAVHWNLAMCYAHLGEWETAFGHVQASGQPEQEFYDATIARGLHPPVHQ